MFLVEKNIKLPEWQALHNMLERALISLQARVIIVYYVGHIIYHNDHNDNSFSARGAP